MPAKKRDQKQMEKDQSANLIEHLKFQLKKVVDEKNVAVQMLQ
jgi:hypothetical protein